MKNDFKGSSRSNYRAKRKKTNVILNGLIVVVLLLIVIVAYSIFLSGNDKTAAKKDVQTTAEKTTAEKKSVHKIEKDSSSAAEKSSTGNKSKLDQENKTNSKTTTSSVDENNSDQLQTVETPGDTASTPANSGQHVTSYDSNSQDWQQMLQVMSSATGVDQGNMTVWFLGSDKSTTNGSVGTISAKDNKQQKFRVHLQWTDGQGWKATNVETLSQ